MLGINNLENYIIRRIVLEIQLFNLKLQFIFIVFIGKMNEEVDELSNIDLQLHSELWVIHECKDDQIYKCNHPFFLTWDIFTSKNTWNYYVLDVHETYKGL